MKLPYFDIDANEFKINNTSINELALRAGGTPFFVYNKSVIMKKINDLRSHLPRDLNIHYAIKANPMCSLVGFIANHVDGFDVSSANELTLALNSGMETQNISFAGPGKSKNELEMAMASKILIVVESQNEINRVLEIYHETKLIPRIALRINPAFEMKSSGMKMSGGAKPFGIDSEKILDCIEQLDKMQIKIEGLHFYLGSQNLSAEIINTTLSSTISLLIELSKHFKNPLSSINLGGGFGIPYFEGELPLNLESLKLPFSDEVLKLRQHYPQCKLSIELGRFIVGESGIYVSKIIDKKISRNTTFIILDGGMNHQLAATGNLGQIIKRHYPIANLNKKKKHKKEIVSISGPLCTPLDSFGKDVEIDQCEIGDFIGIFQSGAYGLSSSPNGFLSHSMAREIII